ncbi:MAG: thiol:disulfide interchange protein DsbA/DsbL [Pseudomonadota bacterium]
MKKITSIMAMPALLVFIAGCSNEEPEAPATKEPVAAVEEAVQETVEAVEEEVATEEEIEVVEESAGDATDAADEAIVLAQADTAETPPKWKFQEGTHFTRLVPTQPTIGGPDKVEVTEIFMYTCPHCMDLEGFMQNWEDTLNPDIRFERIPAIFNQLAALHAQLYYTEDVLARNGQLADRHAFRNMVFNEIHRRNNGLTSQGAIQRVFERAGVDENTFNRTWNSFEVSQSLRKAADLARRYGVDSVPMIIVNGKYRTTASAAGSYPVLIEVINELAAREGAR